MGAVGAEDDVGDAKSKLYQERGKLALKMVVGGP